MKQIKIFKGRTALNGWQDLGEEMNQWIADNTAFISNIIDIRVNSNHSAAGNFLLGYIIYDRLTSLTNENPLYYKDFTAHTPPPEVYPF